MPLKSNISPSFASRGLSVVGMVDADCVHSVAREDSGTSSYH